MQATERVRLLDARLDGLHGEELAARHLLQRRRVEDVVHALYGVRHCKIRNLSCDLLMQTKSAPNGAQLK